MFPQLFCANFAQLYEQSKKDEKRCKNAKIIFTSADKKTTESLYLEQARRINALLTNKTINGFKTESLFSNQKLYLYFIGEDRKKNIKLALDKFEEIKNTTRKTKVYAGRVWSLSCMKWQNIKNESESTNVKYKERD